MTRPASRFRPLILTLAAALALVLFAACGDDDDDGGDGEGATATTSATEDGGGAGGEIDISGVPELEDGMLTVGSDIAYPPIEFFEEGTQNAIGLDVDIMAALADKLGVDFEFQQVADFAGIVGDLKSKRYDVVMSAISITEERSAEIDFVPYFGPAGTGVIVAAGNPEGIEAVEDLCGKAVAAQVGTIQVDYMNEFNADQCADDPIDIQTFPDTPSAVQEVSLGRVAAALADDPVAAYAALQSDGELEVAVTGFDSAPYGIGVRKDSPELKAALEAALAAVREDGTYDEILAKWGQEDLAYQD